MRVTIPRSPLPLRELKAEAVEHELVLVVEDVLCPGLLGREANEFIELVQGNVVVYGTVNGVRTASLTQNKIERTRIVDIFRSRFPVFRTPVLSHE